MNNIDTENSYSDRNEIENDSLSNSYKSIISNDNSIEVTNNEFYNGFNSRNSLYNLQNKKQRNSIDYLNINEEDYQKKICYKKINLMLKGLNSLSIDIINEISFLSWYYLKKLPNKKLVTIVTIITYKIIKKYNIKNVTLKDLKEKLNFKYKTYLKNEKLFDELNLNLNQKKSNNSINFNNNINNIIISKKQSFSELVLNSITKNIQLIKEKILFQPNIIKYKNYKPITNKGKIINDKSYYDAIESLFEKISSNENKTKELYTNPIIIELNNCLLQCKSFIYNNKQIEIENNNMVEQMSETNNTNQTINLIEESEKRIYDENTFNEFFENKIDTDNLGLALIKYFIDKNEKITLSYKKMKEIFVCNIYQVKKSISFIKEFINSLRIINFPKVTIIL